MFAHSRVRKAGVFAGLLLLAPPLGAAQSDSENTAAQQPVPATYCGVQALFRATRSLGAKFPFETFLKPKYISSIRGSSLQELATAATDTGFYAEHAHNLSAQILHWVDCPLIMHVKQDVRGRHNHWVLFMGIEGEQARVYDGLVGLELWDVAELSARWDGVGLFVSARPISLLPLWLVTIARYVFDAGLIGAGLCAAILVLSALRRYRIQGVGAEALALALFAVLFALLYWGYETGSGQARQRIVAAIQDAHLAGFLPRIRADQVPDALKDRGLIVVDARPPSDFAAGHLPRARNLALTLSPEECRTAMAGASPTSRILIYCQSNGCKYSESVARTLIGLGYVNIVHFRDGWIGWQEYHNTRATAK